MDKKTLLINALNAASESVEQIAENRFRIGVMEFHVWTKTEAAEFGYHGGGTATADPQHQLYRIF